jgi:predicted neuraminidase
MDTVGWIGLAIAAIMKLSALFVVCGLSISAQKIEFISDQMPTPSCHASTIVELPNGELVVSWFGGTREGDRNVAIWLSLGTASGWSQPIEVVREPGIATYNPVLFNSRAGLLWLYYKFGPHPDSWSAGRRFSSDGGRNWSPVEHLPAGLYGPIRAKPLVMEDGIILSGTSVESYGSWACWVERSTDNGRTWGRYGPIAASLSLQKPGYQRNPGEPYGVIQPSIIGISGKHVRMYVRSTSAIGRICESDSYDGGITWTGLETTALANPNSGIDAIRLRDGRQVIVYNDSTSERTPLNMAVSSDGKIWKMFYVLESDPGEYSYPALIQAKNGDLHITYTWNRKKIRYVRFPLAKVH